MKLSEAKQILNKNGYRLYESFEGYDYTGGNLSESKKSEASKDGKTYYTSCLIQDSESINDLDNYVDNDNIEEAITLYGDLLIDWDDDSVTDYVPYIARGTDTYLGEDHGIVLVRNNSLGGCYMVYRKLTDREVDEYLDIYGDASESYI